MNEAVQLLLFFAGVIGGVFLAVYFCLLPPRLFLRGERWLKEAEFLAAAPGKAWCRRVPMIAALVAFPTYVALFITVQATCRHPLVFMGAMLPLFFLWIYVPIGVVELTARVSVLAPVGKMRGVGAEYMIGPGARRAGAFRLGITAAVLAALLAAAYW
jgi:hypothetical protein